ncbi:MAG TPA: Wzz/FepE/Etk N-terminal domain-containing protein, partial [Ardenticatenaceae bacterium]|nr:Wzz/FepE/Etk N-terminal domain-containing protein [Ardenticatenaceae bacterium]
MPIEQELDLRQYIDVVVRRWRLIVTIAVLAALVAGIRSWNAPTSYRAVATVAIIKSKPEIVLDENFKTLTEENLGTATRGTTEARKSALVGLVRNVAIAQRVLERLDPQFAPASGRPTSLMGKVSGQLVEDADLIEISVSDPNPERAAAIANAWAIEYEQYVNTLYSGAPTEYSAAVSEEVERAQLQHQESQEAVEGFIVDNQIDELTRQIAEKRSIIEALQRGRSVAVSAVISEQLNTQTQIINAYYRSESENRLFAFQKEQEAKRSLLSAYIDAEIQNRLAAFNRDRNIRHNIFSRLVQAELDGTMTVMNEQINERTTALANAYARRASLNRSLEQARLLRAQLEQGGDAAAQTSSLAVLLLKSQLFTSSADGLPANLQLQMSEQTSPTAASLTADLNAVISTLEQRLAELDTEIEQLSQELLGGSGYEFLAGLSPDALTVSTTETVTATEGASGLLSTYITERYYDLYELGGMAQDAQTLDTNTPLFAQIQELYPELFAVDPLMELSASIPVENPLFNAASARAEDLLQGLEAVTDDVTAPPRPLQETILQLQQEIRELSVRVDREESRRQQLIQRRELTWETYTTLSRKQEELQIATAVTGSEVRLAAPAFAPSAPVATGQNSVPIAAAAGLLLGIVLAFALHYLAPGVVPQAIVGRPSFIWNRAFRWVMT